MSNSPPSPPQAAAERDGSLARLTLAAVPVFASTKQAIEELGGRVTLSNTRVAAIALGDPGLTLQLLREANVQAHARRELDIASITHAVSLLGMEQTLRFVAGLRTVVSIRPRARREGLSHALGRAAHAAGLARDWTTERREAAVERAVCAATLRHGAELAVWAGHAEAHELFARLHGAGKQREAQESDVFGESLVSLGERLSAEAHLPASLTAALRDSGALQPRLTSSILASAIAEAAARDWYAPDTLALLTLHAELAGVEPDEGAAQVHALTARVARRSRLGPAIAAARYLLMPPGAPFVAGENAIAPEQTRPAAAPPPTTPPVNKPPPRAKTTPPQPAFEPGRAAAGRSLQDGEAEAQRAARRRSDEGFRRCAALLREARKGNTPLQEMLPQVVDSLREGLGFDRAVFALINRQKQLLQARYTSGRPADAVLEVDLAKNNAMTQLMQAPQGLWLHAASRERLLPYLPRTVRGYLGSRNFCAMSLFVLERPVGLLYADYEGDDVDERAYSRFKQVAVELSGGLTPSRRIR